jgi:hypothetical protein
MNINKLVDALKNVPDQVLISYVKDGNPQVPSVMALAELNRRKEIRASAPTNAPAPTQTVADQITADTQGVAGLPVPEEMYGEQSMAAGGIVSFAGGGSTSQDVAYGNALDQSFLGWMPRAGMATISDVVGLPGQLAWVRDPKTGKLMRRYEMEGWMPKVSGFEESEAARRLKGESRYAELRGAEKAQSPASQAGIRSVVEQGMVDRPAYETVMNMPDVPAAAAPVGKGGIRDVVRSTAGTGAAGAGPRSNVTPAPAVGAYEDVRFKPVTLDEAGYEAVMPAERSMRDYAAEFKAELGEDPGRAAMKERLAAMQAKGEKEAEQAPWMALAKAGLSMASGKSQFALQNIAAGGAEGLKDYAEARDNLRKAEERRFELESKVAQAERAEQLEAIRSGSESKRYDDQARRTIRLQKQSDKANIAAINAKGELDAVEKRYGLQQKDRELAVTQEHYRAMAKAYNKTPAEIQMVDLYAKSKKIPFDQAFEAVMGMKHPGSGGLDEDTILRAYSNGIKDASIDPATTSYAAFKAQIMGGGAPATDYSKWGSPKVGK